MKYFNSDLSGNKYPESAKINLGLIKNEIFNLIKKDYPDINESKYISLKELHEYQHKYIESSFTSNIKKLSSTEKDVIEKVKNSEFISNDLDENFSRNLSFGQRIADKVAEFGGSWRFIISFLVFIALWIIFNTYALFFKAFDVFPFILLNLILSCVAAIQAPIIMMSQNRLEEKDRERSKEDYKVNLKAEMEIRMLEEKLDNLTYVQQQQLIEIQNAQSEILKNISGIKSENNLL